MAWGTHLISACLFARLITGIPQSTHRNERTAYGIEAQPFRRPMAQAS